MFKVAVAGACLSGEVIVAARANEYPIGSSQMVAGMEIGAVYLQPIVS